MGTLQNPDNRRKKQRKRARSCSGPNDATFHPRGVDAKPGAIETTSPGAFNVAQDAAPTSVNSAVAQQLSRARLPGQLPFSGFNPFWPFATAYGTPNQQPRGMAGLGVSSYVASSFMPSLAPADAAGFSGHPAIQGRGARRGGS